MFNESKLLLLKENKLKMKNKAYDTFTIQ